jgi:hypothetical protein
LLHKQIFFPPNFLPPFYSPIKNSIIVFSFSFQGCLWKYVGAQENVIELLNKQKTERQAVLKEGVESAETHLRQASRKIQALDMKLMSVERAFEHFHEVLMKKGTDLETELNTLKQSIREECETRRKSFNNFLYNLKKHAEQNEIKLVKDLIPTIRESVVDLLHNLSNAHQMLGISTEKADAMMAKLKQHYAKIGPEQMKPFFDLSEFRTVNDPDYTLTPEEHSKLEALWSFRTCGKENGGIFAVSNMFQAAKTANHFYHVITLNTEDLSEVLTSCFMTFKIDKAGNTGIHEKVGPEETKKIWDSLNTRYEKGDPAKPVVDRWATIQEFLAEKQKKADAEAEAKKAKDEADAKAKAEAKAEAEKEKARKAKEKKDAEKKVPTEKEAPTEKEVPTKKKVEEEVEQMEVDDVGGGGGGAGVETEIGGGDDSDNPDREKSVYESELQRYKSTFGDLPPIEKDKEKAAKPEKDPLETLVGADSDSGTDTVHFVKFGESDSDCEIVGMTELAPLGQCTFKSDSSDISPSAEDNDDNFDSEVIIIS